jgi:hypothetical protein
VLEERMQNEGERIEECAAQWGRWLCIEGGSTEGVCPKAEEINRPMCGTNAWSLASRSNCYDTWRTLVR